MSIYVGYQGATRCTDGPTDGARALMSWYLAAYAEKGARNLGIYNCRTVRGGRTTSLHGEGRAVDLGIPKPTVGFTRLANQLRLNSRELGVQCVIYNRRIWSGAHPYEGWRRYTGLVPHTNHLHVELSRSAARGLTVARVREVLGGDTPTEAKDGIDAMSHYWADVRPVSLDATPDSDAGPVFLEWRRSDRDNDDWYLGLVGPGDKDGQETVVQVVLRFENDDMPGQVEWGQLNLATYDGEKKHHDVATAPFPLSKWPSRPGREVHKTFVAKVYPGMYGRLSIEVPQAMRLEYGRADIFYKES